MPALAPADPVKLPAKTEYGTLAMLTLAANCAVGDRLQIKRIADDHGIPARFLVQILLELKRAHLVESIRGASGGYRLARPAEQITLGEVMAALDNRTSRTALNGHHTPLERALAVAWRNSLAAQQAHLDGITLADLVEQAANRREAMWFI